MATRYSLAFRPEVSLAFLSLICSALPGLLFKPYQIITRRQHNVGELLPRLANLLRTTRLLWFCVKYDSKFNKVHPSQHPPKNLRREETFSPFPVLAGGSPPPSFDSPVLASKSSGSSLVQSSVGRFKSTRYFAKVKSNTCHKKGDMVIEKQLKLSQE